MNDEITQEMVNYCKDIGNGKIKPRRKKFGLCFNFTEMFLIDLHFILNFKKYPNFSGHQAYPISSLTNERCHVEKYKLTKNQWDKRTRYGKERYKFCLWCAAELERLMNKQEGSKMKKFIKQLEEQGYTYKLKDKRIIITHYKDVYLVNLETLPKNVVFKNKGSVYLNNLKTIPRNTVFKNKKDVYLNNLKTLSENVVFKNKKDVYLRRVTTIFENALFENTGIVYFRALTSLPEKVTFKNTGTVYLIYLTSLPASTTFKNTGFIYLNSLRVLPENILFNNSGNIFLGSLRTKQLYQNKLVEFKQINGFQMILTSSKKFKDYTLHRAKYLRGGSIRDMQACFIAEKNGVYALGETTRQAIQNVEENL